MDKEKFDLKKARLFLFISLFTFILIFFVSLVYLKVSLNEQKKDNKIINESRFSAIQKYFNPNIEDKNTEILSPKMQNDISAKEYFTEYIHSIVPKDGYIITPYFGGDNIVKVSVAIEHFFEDNLETIRQDQIMFINKLIDMMKKDYDKRYIELNIMIEDNSSIPSHRLNVMRLTSLSSYFVSKRVKPENIKISFRESDIQSLNFYLSIRNNKTY